MIFRHMLELTDSKMMRFFAVLFTLVFVSSVGFAQDFQRIRVELQDRQKETNSQIHSLQQLILGYEQHIIESDSRYETLYREFQTLEREIAVRDAVIREFEERGRQIAEDIRLIVREYEENKQELERLIENYKQSLSYLYKHGRISEIAYLLTSGSFNQMLVRSYYLRRFEEQRTSQARQIEEAQENLKRKQEELVAAREDVQKNLMETREARAALAETRRRQDQTIAQLRQDRRQTQTKLTDARSSVENLIQVLNNTIAELDRVQREEEERIRQLEAERLKRLAEAKLLENEAERERLIARYSEPITSAGALPSAEALATLTQSFLASKGKLPMPVSGGVITAPFGMRVHPVYRTELPNPGIEVSTEARSPVLAVHDGYVSQIMRIPDYDDVVIVTHGNYRTIYGNLSEVMVSQNMYLRAGDLIGRSGVSNSAMGTSVFFMVRVGPTNVNPSDWLEPQRRRAP